jgi:hypothetical protein
MDNPQTNKPEEPKGRPARGRDSEVYDAAYDDGSDYGPTDWDTESWAERERRRRAAWLAGPSEDEKLAWARRERRRRSTGRGHLEDPSGLGPADEEVEAWAERERRRREAWLAGPSEDEKYRYARGERRYRRDDGGGRWYDRYGDDRDRIWDVDWWLGRRRDRDSRDDDYDETVYDRVTRDAIYAAEGAMDMLASGPFRAFSRLVRNGRDWEEDDYRPRRPRRIRYNDDW